MNHDPRHDARHDPRAYGGGGEEYAPQPVARPAPPQAAYPPPPALHAESPYAPHATMPAAPYPAPPAAAAPAAISAAQGAPTVDDDGEMVDLSRSYRAHDENVRTLRFRKPTGADLRKYGYPIRQILSPDTGRVESIEINAAIAAKYVVALSNPPIPPSTLDSMDIHDADACNGAIVRFFMR